MPAAGGVAAVADDDEPGVLRVPHPDPAAVMDGDPGRAARGVQEGVQERPVGHRVGAVAHRLGLAVRARHRAAVEVVPADDDGGLEFPPADHLVERQAQPVALSEAHPADARRQPLELDVLAGRVEPVVEVRVVGDQFLDLRVRPVDVLGIAGQRGPAERSDAAAEEGTHVGGDETGEGEGAFHPGAERLLADVVPVVEGRDAGVVEAEHGADVAGDGTDRGGRDGVGIALSPRAPLLDGPARRQVAVRGVVRRRLVGEGVGADAAGEQLREDLRGVSDEAHGQGSPGPDRSLDQRQRLVHRFGPGVEVSGREPPFDPVRLALDGQERGAGHLRGERLRSSHAAEPGGQDPASGEVPAVVLAAHLHEGLVGALDDPLAPDVDPGSGGHLAEHHQALAVEFPEVLPVGPGRHQVGVGDEHARRFWVGPEDADRLAGLDQQGLVRFEIPERRDDRLVGLPVPGRLPDPPVDHEVLGALRDLGVEVVHQHAERRLGEPALRRQEGARRGLDGPAPSLGRGSSWRLQRRPPVRGGPMPASRPALRWKAAKSAVSSAVRVRSTCCRPPVHLPFAVDHDAFDRYSIARE